LSRAEIEKTPYRITQTFNAQQNGLLKWCLWKTEAQRELSMKKKSDNFSKSNLRRTHTTPEFDQKKNQEKEQI
jgi:hypothetical protein